MGKNKGPISAFVDRSLFWDSIGEALQLIIGLAVPGPSMSCFLLNIFAVEFSVMLHNRRKTLNMGSFLTPIFRGRGHLKFWTCIFTGGETESSRRPVAKGGRAPR